MQEYIKITQTNQEMLNRMPSKVETQFFEPTTTIVKDREIPILNGFVDPVTVPNVLKEEVHKLMKRPSTAFAIGSESVERQKGRKHYYKTGG